MLIQVKFWFKSPRIDLKGDFFCVRTYVKCRSFGRVKIGPTDTKLFLALCESVVYETGEVLQLDHFTVSFAR